MERIVRVAVVAGARKESCIEVDPDTFTIATKEPAAGNRANIRVREILAAYFGVPFARVYPETGHHSQKKRFRIREGGA